MKGLKTQENNKFKLFFELIQKEAEKKNSIFFLDTGQGNQFENEKIEGEDLSGWLVPLSAVDEFENEWLNKSISDKWDDNYIWAEWEFSENGNIIINLITY